MKNLILIILLLINSILTFGQKSHKILYKNGQLKEIGQFDKDEKPTGEWKFYNENGNLANVIEAGSGLTKNFDENSRLYCIGRQEIGVGKIGEWKYYSSKGCIVTIENYKGIILNRVI